MSDIDELRDMVAALPNTAFEIHLVMNLAIVGNGLYRLELVNLVAVKLKAHAHLPSPTRKQGITPNPIRS